MDQGSATETQDKEICRCISSWGKVRQLEMGGGGESLNLGFLCLYSEGRWETRWLHFCLVLCHFIPSSHPHPHTFSSLSSSFWL